MNVLIVDDNQENLYLLENLLTGFSHNVQQAPNGEEALSLLRRESFDMVISDVLMPVMDGYQLCRKVRSDNNLKDILFIFYTATYLEDEDEAFALKLGADRFIRKPMEPALFMEIINQLIQDVDTQKITPSPKSTDKEEEIVQLYNERLVNKLEKKMLDLEKEVAERKLAQKALQKSEEQFRKAFEHAAIGKIITTASGRFIKVNQSICDILGYTRQELLGKSCDDVIHPEHAEAFKKAVKELLEGTAASFTMERQFLHKQGNKTWIRLNIVMIRDLDEEHIYLVGDAEDITERKLAADQIQRDLKEKEILLKEIHHRVKNNLQVIISLLNMRAQSMTDKRIAQTLFECKQRIRSIAMAHEKIYALDTVSHIDFADYLESMISELKAIHHTDPSKIIVRIKGEKLFMNLDYTIPCGLVINELITNALKHAFPESHKKGIIELTFGKVDQNTVEIGIKDNGVGLPEEIDFNEKKSLGLYLTKILVEDQLGGNLIMENDNGASIKFRFEME